MTERDDPIVDVRGLVVRRGVPSGFSHALVLCAGSVVAGGPLDEVLTDDVLSRAFQLPIAVQHRDGRAWARLRG